MQTMQLSSEDVAQIVSEVWSAMLGRQIEHVVEPIDFPGSAIAGSVTVSGPVDCLISLETDLEGARAFTAEMFGMDLSEVSQDDVTDATGELTNMVGGNIKSLLPEPSVLSLPVVACGAVPPTLRVVGGKVLMDMNFASGEHPIHLTVYSRPGSN